MSIITCTRLSDLGERHRITILEVKKSAALLDAFAQSKRAGTKSFGTVVGRLSMAAGLSIMGLVSRSG